MRKIWVVAAGAGAEDAFLTKAIGNEAGVRLPNADNGSADVEPGQPGNFIPETVPVFDIHFK
jgi:hypothetical protein